MKIYFVRHGETTYNARDVYQPLDSPLSELGHKQAEFLAERFKTIPIDVILSSPLYRTQQTTEKIKKIVDRQVVWVDELKEYRRPSEFIGKNRTHVDLQEIKNKIDENESNPDWHYSDEENFFDAKNRAIQFIELLNTRTEKNIIAVTHGEILRTIIGVMFLGSEMTVEEYNRLQKFLKTSNTGITICEKENGIWKLLTWNDHAHLG